MAGTKRSDDWGFPRWRPYGKGGETARVRTCDRDGCDAPGDRPAPKAPNSPERWYFCETHAAEYNRNWDYFAGLDAKDTAKWETVKQSTAKEINYYWMPGTKVIGAVEFGPNKIHGTPADHGTGTTSVSVGNIHGTCPECLLFFIDINAAERMGNGRFNRDRRSDLGADIGMGLAVNDRGGNRGDRFGGGLRVGQHFSARQVALPAQYRERYKDSDASYYSYDDDRVYQIDRATGLIMAMFDIGG